MLIVDNDKNVYLTKVVKFKYNKFDKSDENYKKYLVKSNFKIKNYISKSYDNFLNKKYEVVINENTLERLKNYFK